MESSLLPILVETYLNDFEKFLMRSTAYKGKLNCVLGMLSGVNYLGKYCGWVENTREVDDNDQNIKSKE